MKKVWIDTDVSGDSVAAIAMLLESQEDIEIVGISTITSSTWMQSDFDRVKEMLCVTGNDKTPVLHGVKEKSNKEVQEDINNKHGKESISAEQAIVNIIMDNPMEITLLLLGPLTNISRALELEPEITEKINEVVIMGGAIHCHGNMTPVAEVNFYMDPSAAHKVIYADWPIILAGLDVCHFSYLPPILQEKIYSALKPITPVLTKSLKEFHAFLQTVGHGVSYYLPDGIATAYLLVPEIFTFEEVPIYIETVGTCRGMSVPIWSDRWAKEVDIANDFELDSIGKPIKVLLTANKKKFLALLEKLLT